MQIGLIEPHYFPSLEYFSAILPFDKIILEQHAHFVKQSYRNRCYINTAQGPGMLVVPLLHKQGKVPLGEVRIDQTIKWQNHHWRTVHSAYARSPFFEHYRDDLYKVLYGDVTFLVDLNRDILSFCLHSLGLNKELAETEAYEMESKEGISDLRSQISPKTPFSGRTFYQPVPYRQVFGNAFAGNLSLIDLLCCEGPRSLTLLKASGKDN